MGDNRKIKQEPFELHFNKYDNIDDILTPVKSFKYKGVDYLNVACAFDTETSSFYIDNQKRACMYLFGIAINGKCYVGRTYDDMIYAFERITEYYNLDDKRHILCYVHNLAYDMQFIRKWFKFTKVFAIDERKPVYAITTGGIEFRCSYILSGYNLETIGKNLTTYKVKKLVGDLDYSLIRTPKTKIQPSEMAYMINDCLVLNAYIQEFIDHLGRITKIQITKTAFTRKLCRDNCFKTNGKQDLYKLQQYHKFMQKLTIKSPQEYAQMRRAFSGGFTHANALKVGKVYEDVASYDFTSSYP